MDQGIPADTRPTGRNGAGPPSAARAAAGSIRWLAWTAILSAAGCWGNTPPPVQTTSPRSTSQPAQSPAEDYDEFELPEWTARTHVVQPNETLYSLAQKYYGNVNQFRRIYYANRNRLSGVNNLPVGIKLIIPPSPKL